MGSVIVSRRLAAGFHPAQSGRHGTSVQNAPRRSGFAWTHRCTAGKWIRTFGSGASGEADAILPVKDRPR
jgi:hypothetical protein